MPRSRKPKGSDNQLTASEAMSILGITSKPAFYKLVKSVKNPNGRITPHLYPFLSERYKWYDKAEVERVRDEEDARLKRKAD
jgi:hypothetical protein